MVKRTIENIPPDPITEEFGPDEREMTVEQLFDYYGLTNWTDPDTGNTLILNADGTPLDPLHYLWRKFTGL